MTTEQLKQFKENLQRANDSLTKKDFETAFAALVKFVKDLKLSLEDKNFQTVEELRTLINQLAQKLENLNEEKLGEAQGKINKALEDQRQSLNYIRDWTRNLKNGRDGRDSDPQEVALLSSKIAITEVLKQIPPPDTAQQVLDKVISLDGENGLRIEDIYELRKELDELRQLKGTRTFGGGGLSASAMNLHFSDFYTPTGDVNGVNTDFVLTNTPSPASSLEVYLQGQLQDLTTNYTLSGKTITFLEAPITGNSIKVKHRV